jgi:hypothetical protein
MQIANSADDVTFKANGEVSVAERDFELAGFLASILNRFTRAIRA